MMGKLGFDIVVSQLKEKDLEFCQNAIKTYNSVKQIIWQGDQYRLSDPTKNNVASIMYLNEAKSSGVIFNYLVNYRYGSGSNYPIRLKGLDATKKYNIREINLYPGTSSSLSANKSYMGDFLMTIGFNPDVNASRTSVVLQIEEFK
jgi:alpha-galactosidase